MYFHLEPSNTPQTRLQVYVENTNTGVSVSHDNATWLPNNANCFVSLGMPGIDNTSGVVVRISSPNYITAAYANRKKTFKTADRITVPKSGHPTIDDTFDVYFTIPDKTITGYVKNTSGGALAGVTVNIFEADSANDPAHYWLAQTVTDAQGKYEFKGVYGDVDYHIKAEKDSYFPMFASKTTSGGAYSPVNIRSGDSVQEIRLGSASTLTGTITGGANGELVAYLASGMSSDVYTYVNNVTISPNGSYTIPVPAGVPLVLQASKAGYLTTFYGNNDTAGYGGRAATGITAPATVPTFPLPEAVKIGGTITDGVNGVVATVNVFVRTGSPSNYKYAYVNRVTANSNGTYSDKNLWILSGKDQVVVAEKSGYLSRYFGGSGGAYERDKATLVSTARSDVNITLEQTGSITGTVSGASGAVTINVYGKSGQTLEYLNSVAGIAGSAYILPAPINTSRELVVQAEKPNYLSRFHNNTYELDKAVAFKLTSTTPKTGVDIALQEAALISGKITNGVNGVNAKVSAFRKNGSVYEYVNSVTADANGDYTNMQIVKNVDQVILASRSGYIDRYYQSGTDGTYNRDKKATLQKTAAGNIHITLQQALTAAGSVKERGTNNSLNIPMTVNAFIKGRDYDSGYVTAAAVNSTTGAFSMQIPADPAGIVLQVTHNSALIGYKDGSWFVDNGSVMSSADAKVLHSADSNLQIRLDKFWLVKGAVSPAGIQGVVDLYEWESSGVNYNKNKGWATANASGAYEIRGTGNVNVLLRAGTENYVTRYLSNANQASPAWTDNPNNLVKATAQLVLVPLSTYTYNPSLTLGGQISGTISASGGSGAVTVSVETVDGKFFKEITANVGVKYAIKGIPAGSWKVRASRSGAMQIYYGGAYGYRDAATINLTTAGKDNIDITLPAKHVISGEISGASSGAVTVNAFELTGGHLGRWVSSYTRNGNGAYSLDAPDGVSVILMAESAGYMNRFYQSGSSGTYSEELATPLSAAASLANITLEARGSIAGTVTSKTGSGVVTVSAFEKNGDALTYICSVTGSVGTSWTYTLPAPINSGRTLVVQAEKADHIKRFYKNTYSLGQASTFNLSSAAPKSGVDIDLEQGVVLSGTISPAGVTVQVFVRADGDAKDTFLMEMKTADSGGAYAFNVPRQNKYFIRAEKTGFFPGFYRSDNASAAFGEQDRQPIIVAASNVTGKNFSLYAAKSIAGDVKYRGGGDIGRVVTVNAFMASTNYIFVSVVTTNAAAGSFSLPVPQGVNLVLQVTANPALGYASGTWFPDRESSANSTIFNVSSDLSGQHFIIDKFWHLTGKVQLDDQTTPVGVSVDVFDYASVTGGADWKWLAGVTIDNAGGDFVISSINSVEAVVRYSKDGYVTKIYPDLVTLNKIGASNKQTLTIGDPPQNLSPQTLARGGSISGTVHTQGSSGTVTVNVEDLLGNYFTSVTRNGGGAYTVPNLPSGNWLVRAAQDGTVAEYYGETASTTNAATVSVIAGQTAHNIDIYIAKEWTISGNVSEFDSSPAKNIDGALAQAYFVTSPNIWFWVASANTDANGNYTLRGGYSNKQNNPTQVFLQIGKTGYTATTTDPISVNVAVGYTDKNYQLEGAAYVKGSVVNVSANKTVTINVFEKGSNFVFAGEVTINGNDTAPVNYVLPIKANKDLVVRAAVSGYEDLWYDNKTSSADAEAVKQSVGTTKDAVNFDFAGHKQWRISGVIKDADNHPLGGLTVNVFVKDSNYAGPEGGSVQTGADGRFSLQIAPTKDLVLQAVTKNQYLGYPTGTYYKKDASGIISSADATLLAYSAGDQENLDFKIDRFWLVSGKVSPNNIEAVIDMYEYAGANIDWTKNKGWVTANASGNYEIRGTGNVNVTVNIRAATGNYIAKSRDQAVLRPENTYMHNFELTPGAEISGWVTANGSGTVTLSAQDINGRWETFVTRDGTGAYNIPLLPAGVWLVYAQKDNCVAEYFGETNSTRNAARITLAAGQVTQDINIEIDREWIITGNVQDSGGQPVAGAEIDVWKSLENWDFIGRAKTDASGYYIVTGGYNNLAVYVRVSADGYETQYYDGRYIVEEANTINMSPGSAKTGVDFILRQVWKVAGNVRDTRNNYLSGAKVSLIDGTNTQNILDVYTTDASGEYRFVSTNAVTYNLFLLVEKDGYVPSSSAAFSVATGDSKEFYFVLPLAVPPVQPLPPGQSVLDTIRSGPNPADPEEGPIHIGFILDRVSRARVKVYTLGGELVFQDDKNCAPGYAEFVWSGANLYDRRLPNGVYLAYVEIDTGQEKLRKVLKIAILR
jgi:protocatechuate 3,4-dioxygenase beta subunit